MCQHYEDERKVTFSDKTLIKNEETNLAKCSNKMKLAEFAKWAITKTIYAGSYLDGGEVQDMAVKLGLLIKTKYDPAVHEPSAAAVTGDDWLVFSDEFETAVSLQSIFNNR